MGARSRCHTRHFRWLRPRGRPGIRRWRLLRCCFLITLSKSAKNGLWWATQRPHVRCQMGHSARIDNGPSIADSREGLRYFRTISPLPQGLRISNSVSLSTFLVQNRLKITVPTQNLLTGHHFLQAPRRNHFRSKRKGVLD